MTEGIIKYSCHHDNSSIQEEIQLSELNDIRSRLLERNWIGHDSAHDIGFGNVSLQHDDEQFLISGSQTGHLSQLSKDDVALVTKVNLQSNQLWCTGKTVASSESMTHAALYLGSEGFFNSVLHIHDAALWQKWKGVKETTDTNIKYGTPQMAMALFELAEESVESHLVVVMGGHKDGIIAGGITIECAYQALVNLI